MPATSQNTTERHAARKRSTLAKWHWLVRAGYAQHTTTQGTAAYAYSPTMPCAEHLGQVVAAALNRSPDKHLTLSLGMSGAGLGHLADLLTDLGQ